ncbi:DnaA N-terminal domain-containing protein [Ferdinandcohnia sp. SAFN-114]|uniref:helix-turn-helix domain-containing protein n=1 Tax=Ferdinandcohnia sp. SAFN-114 TaxID=3387275 RepID=UPI003F812349
MSEDNKNLKGRTDKLSYYRYVETGNKYPRQRSKKGKDSGLELETYYVPELEKRVFTEDEVRAFSLDKYGHHIPYVDGEITILNNYLFDYWGHYLNAEGLALYAHLKRHAYGKKDWCFPNLELISLKMDKSLNTVRNYLDILERYGFIYKFNVVNEDRDKLEESPVYKIRKKVPLLTEKLLNGDPSIVIDDATLEPHIKKALKKEKAGLPKLLREDHDEYVADMIANSESIDILDSISYEEIFGEMLSKAKKVKETSVQREKMRSHSLFIQPKHLKEQDIIVWQGVLKGMETKISKPSFDTWLRGTYCIKEGNKYFIYATNEFQKDWLVTRYNDQIQEELREFDPHFDELEYTVAGER